MNVGLRPLRIVFAGHDLKFADALIHDLEDPQMFEIRRDRWTSFSTHDRAASEMALAWADIVVCEWCGPNAVWYSHRLRPDQRMVIRLHRFELDTEHPGEVASHAVGAVVAVSPHYRVRATAAMPGIAPDRIVTIGNGVDLGAFDRPKELGARFQIGMIGIVPSRKRLDRALDVLASVRRRNDHFSLLVKSQMPWDHRWIWNDSAEQRYFGECLRRVQTDPLLVDAVAFDPAGSDVPEWLTGIGSVLSTSDDESFHLSPAEGMASGAVPVIFPWAAAHSVYDPRWIVDSVEEAADRILELSDSQTWTSARRRARADAAVFDHRHTTDQWRALLTGLIG